MHFLIFLLATTLHGRVLDSRSGEPVAKAIVAIRELNIETRTNDNGEFDLPNIPAGEIELQVTTVGYGLVRRKLDVTEVPIELEVLLGPEVLRRTDEVSVTEKVFLEPPAAVSDHSLNQAEFKNLSSVLIDDPLRSVQALPGVTTGDDFFAQFSARGAGFRSIGYTTDGILIYSPMHEVGDVNDGGSLSMLNADVIDTVTLYTGGFPPKYGDRTAGFLNIITRDGSRERFVNTAIASASGISWTSEGPIGKARKPSWLFSARKSYLDYLVRKLSDDPASSFILGFYDFFGKLSIEPTTRHQLRLSGNFGKSRVDQRRDKSFSVNDFLFGDSRTQVGIADWLWIVSNNLTLDSAVSYDNVRLNNANHDHALLFNSDLEQVGIKQDLAYQPSVSNKIESGYLVRRLSQNTNRRRFQSSSQQFRQTDSFSGSMWQPGVYVQHTATGLNSRLAFTWGGRFEHLDLTGQNIWMPRGSLAFSVLPGTQITLAYGQYSQFPNLTQFMGQAGNRNLRAERASHYTFEIEQTLNDRTRIRVEAYNREDRDGIYSVDTEYRLVNGRNAGPVLAAPGQLQNNLRGHARGVEIFIQRRSVNKLSGWVSYSYGVARYRDAATNLSFDGDYDQRHTFNAYATYRLRPSLNLSARFRYGSNFPIVGFLKFDGTRVVLSDQRNQVRMPVYSRLDVRANKSFNFDRWKLTLYAEVLNLLARENIRYTTQSDTANGRLSINRDSMFPLLPSAGIRVEF
jgi:Carboxypeptidase regulatory-like domain/TonB-dependent Receptor Plug Domain